MKLALNILLKDLRRHRWEILAFVASLACWLVQKNLDLVHDVMEGLVQALPYILGSLIVIRIVQGESLIGTREFWPTRPYRPAPLICAKIAAIVIGIHLPLFIAQLYLLHHAGIPITASILGGLLYLQLALAFLLILPTAALASVTATTVQWVLTVIGIVMLYVILAWIPWRQGIPALAGSEYWATWIGFIPIAAALIAILLWQYNRRRPRPARILVGLAIIVGPLCVVLLRTELLNFIAYPASDAQPPIRISLPANRMFDRFDYPGGDSAIFFEFNQSSVSQDTIVAVEGERFHLRGNGINVDTDWTTSIQSFAPLEQADRFTFQVPTAIASQIAARQPNVEAELAVALYTLDAPHRVDTRSDTFNVPGIASCTWNSRTAALRSETSCYAPLRLPEIYMAVLDSGESTCRYGDHSAQLPSGHYAVSIQYDDSLGPASFDADPTHFYSPTWGFSGWTSPIPDLVDPKRNQAANICRGTPFTIRTGHLDRRMRINIPLGPLGKEVPAKVTADEPVSFRPAAR